MAETVAVIVELHDWMLPGEGTSRTVQQAMLGQDRDLLVSGENLVWIKADSKALNRACAAQ